MKSPARSFKWIFFRIINYIQIVVALFFIVLITIGNWSSGITDSSDILSYIVAVLVFGIFVANGLSNLYLIERFFPDKLPPKAAWSFNMVTYVLLIIFSSLQIIVTFAMVFSRIETGNVENGLPLIAIIFFGSMAATSVPLWFLQMQLRSTLKRNYYAAFDEFLETENP